jgi:glycosidase
MNSRILKIAFLFVTLIPFLYAQSQLVSTDPPIPLAGEAVVVTFDATLGSGGLEGYSGDVYAHTGVITENSTGGSDWKYVKTDWGQNSPDTKLDRIGQDLYQLDIGPSIMEYYGVPGNEEILQMAFVFRSGVQVGGNWLSGRTEEFGDIFIDVYEAGLAVTFVSPEIVPVIVEINDTIFINIQANEADSVSLLVEDMLIKKIAGTELIDTIVTDQFGKYWVKAVAEDMSGTVEESFHYIVRDEVVVEERPAGTRDGINYLDDNTALLSLIAPGKEYIYVLGDFNNWELDPDSYMKKTPDGTRFWLEVNGLEEGKEYAYQYFIDGKLKIADPFAEKVLDPWNDPFIPEENYPGLMEYPTGKGLGIVSVLQTAQEEYEWEVTNFEPPKVTDMVVYELLVRDFTSKSSYDRLLDSLDYLANLGVNVIELMPVNEFEGNISWGYNPSYYFAPDKYYGPKNKLKEFIDECHKRGIAVFIDMVLNHSYGQSPLVQMYIENGKPAPDNPWYNVDHNFTNPDAQWGYDFNHESQYTQDLVDSINSFWMSEYKFDGFRFDFTKGFGNNIKGSNDPWGSNYDADRIALLKRMADEIWERNPKAIVCFEHLSENSEEKELADYGIILWGNFNYNYAEAAMGYHESGKSNFSLIDYRLKNWNDPHLLGYMESHDEERIPVKIFLYGNNQNPDYQLTDTTNLGERLLMNALFFFTIPGPKMLWQFGEMAYDYSIEYKGRTGPKPVRWDYLEDYRRKYLSDFYGALIKLRIEHPAFESEDFTLNVSTAMKRILINHESMNVVIVGNFDIEEGQLVPGFHHTGTWYNYFTGEPKEVTDVTAQMTLAPGEHYMFTDQQLPVPDIGTGILEGMFPEIEQINVYPNPSSDQIYIDLPDDVSGNAQLDFIDNQGRLISSLPLQNNQGEVSISVSELPVGIYYGIVVGDKGIVGRTGPVIIN